MVTLNCSVRVCVHMCACVRAHAYVRVCVCVTADVFSALMVSMKTKLTHHLELHETHELFLFI